MLLLHDFRLKERIGMSLLNVRTKSLDAPMPMETTEF